MRFAATYTSFSYQAQSWSKPRRIVAKVEWDPGELYPRLGFIVTNLARSAERVVAFHNQRGTCEQYIKEVRNAIKWTRCHAARSPSTPFAFNSMCWPTTYGRPVCKPRFTGMSDQSARTYPVSRHRAGQHGDPRIPVLITSAASSAT